MWDYVLGKCRNIFRMTLESFASFFFFNTFIYFFSLGVLAKWMFEEALQTAEKRREAKGKWEKESDMPFLQFGEKFMSAVW